MPEQALLPEVDRAVRVLMEPHGGFGGVKPLSRPALVVDDAQKSIVFNPRGQPSLFVMVSPATHPGVVGEAAQHAHRARARLGPAAGAAVLTPLFIGVSAGCSFAITPFLSPVVPYGLSARWQRYRLRTPVLDWLRDVTRLTATAPAADHLAVAFEQPLERLASHAQVSEVVRANARLSLRDLHSGVWPARWVLAHGDFWLANLLLAPRRDSASTSPGFAVIDWGGSRLRGHAIYDLVRMSMSLRLPASAFIAEVEAHSKLLECEQRHARHHLVCALAQLADHLGAWPVARFAELADACIHYIDQAR